MNFIRCRCCNTPMQKVRKRPILRCELNAPPSYECPKCYATANCEKDGTMKYYDATGKPI